MRPAVCLAAALVLAAGCGGTKSVTRTVTVDSSAKRGVGAPLERVEFGYIKSLEQKGADYELKFDPAWVLSGETANKAAAEDGAVPPGEPVPNDNYVGATTLHPETRTWLHLHHDDPQIGRMRARFDELAAEELDVVAVQLADGVDRQRVRHGAVALFAERGLLSGRQVCDPPLPAKPTSQAEELVAAVEERLRG